MRQKEEGMDGGTLRILPVSQILNRRAIAAAESAPGFFEFQDSDPMRELAVFGVNPIAVEEELRASIRIQANVSSPSIK